MNRTAKNRKKGKETECGRIRLDRKGQSHAPSMGLHVVDNSNKL